MAEVAVGRDPVADKLLELLHLREAALIGTRPHRVFADADLEDAAGARDQHHPAKLAFEGGEQFLGRMEAKQGDPSETLAFFATHPPSADRAKAIRERAGAGAPALTDAEWTAIRAMCA